MALPVTFDYRRGNDAIRNAAKLQAGIQGSGGGFVAAPGSIGGTPSIMPGAGPSEPKRYGDMQQLSAQLVQNVDNLVLTRSDNLRVFLLIYNSSAVNLYYAFDQNANAACVPIPPGGNLFFDNAVPQNDLHLFYTGGLATQIIPVQYIVSPK